MRLRARIPKDPGLPRFPEHRRGQIQAMQRAPDDEGPCEAVPEPGEEKRDHERCGDPEIPSIPPLNLQGLEDVVENPSRKRNMPAPPEVRHGGGAVRRIEIF